MSAGLVLRPHERDAGAGDAKFRAHAGQHGRVRGAEEEQVDDPSQSARAFYVSSPEPKD